eukprot:CAMPEP_0119061786 /NCGR_PEP_ID=MMETSP1178-20130426/5534_1 /TAXON_ID=33656 /ORGANISM="unid sp, Strain CCMP2000" /LENGTH=233 /DNA_ID=CAMNT_0007043023 /DNA_START=29 /DNA_END=730 /DNA_ORIENTATION=-
MLSSCRLLAVLFDIDGTLFNSDAIHCSVFREMLVQEGFDGGRPISEAFFMERISGRSNPLITADLFPSWDESKRAAFVERKEARFRQQAAERLASLATPGLQRLLDTLQSEGVHCAAVTNAPRLNAELMLGAIGRQSFFRPLIIGDECSAAKPHPEPYLAAMRALGVSSEACLAVEDSPSGARAAVAAGVRTIGITSTQRSDALVDAGCALLVQDFDDPRLWQELRTWQISRV